jgi:hypothetical protein
MREKTQGNGEEDEIGKHEGTTHRIRVAVEQESEAEVDHAS